MLTKILKGEWKWNQLFFFLPAFLVIISCNTEPNFNPGWTLLREKQDDITYYALHFSDESTGWIVGYSGTIKRTSNGGDTWITQQSGVQSNLWDVCFINNQIGWVCGADNTLLKTVNAGESWNTVSLGDFSNKVNVAIKFIDDNNGWLSNNNGEILKSSDGGLTWQVVKQKNVGGARLAVFDENTVYFLSGKLFRTFDGGVTWDSLSVSTPNNYMNSEMFFSDPDNGYIVTVNGTGGMIISEYPIVMTKNGGSNWQSSDYLKSDGFRCVYFTDENNGWVAGNNIYKTNDGGESWILDYSPKTSTLNAKDLYFINENCGWLINWDGQIYKYESD